MTDQKISPAISRWHRHLCAIIVFIVSYVTLIGFCSQQISANSGQVSATVCDDSPPSLTIVEPTDESISTTGQIRISGVALRTTQIDISVNGALVQSVAIGSDPNFSISMGLNEGENTLVLDAYFSCNQRHASETFKVTVDLPETESNPQTVGQTDRISTDSSRSRSNSKFDSTSRVSDNESSRSISRPKKSKDRLRRNLGLSPTLSHERDVVRPIFSWLSVLFIIVSVIIFIYPLILDSLFAKFKSSTSRTKRRMIIRKRHKLIRIIFLFIAVTLGVILQI